MNLFTKSGMSILLARLKTIIDGFILKFNKNKEDRQQYLLEIDYDKDLKFEVNQIVDESI